MSAPRVDVGAIIRKAESQLGVTEKPFGSNRTPYGAWYPMNGVAWCFIFVSWVLHHAGYGFLKLAWTPAGREWAEARGCWAGKSVAPKRGWIVLFNFPGDGVDRISHVGIVTHDGYDSQGRVRTIEGNTNPAGSRTGGMVMRHNRSLSGIVGYIRVDDIGAKPPAKPIRRKWLQVSPGVKDPDLAYFGGFDNQVAEVQLRLNAARFGPLEVDGVFGPKTQAAAKAWKDSWRDFQRYVGQQPWPVDDTPDIGPLAIAALRWATSG